MPASIVSVPDERRSWRRNLLLLLPGLLVFLLLTGVSVWKVFGAIPLRQTNGMPISDEIETRFGVRFTGVHVLANGGLVDLRYRVVDVGKAKNFGHYTETAPLIINERTGATVEVTIMGLHNHRVEAGRIYYILYRNTGDALHPDDRVTIQIGDLRLEGFPVQ